MFEPFGGPPDDLVGRPAEHPLPRGVDAQPDAVRPGDTQHVLAHIPDAVALGGAFLDLPGERPVEIAQRCQRSEEHTSELQSLMRISYAVFCLKNKKKTENVTSMQ